MKILTAIIKTLLNMVFIAFIATIAILILTIIMPENALKALEIIKGLIS